MLLNSVMTFTTLLTPVHSENDSRVYFLIVLITDYCWCSWTCCIAALYKSYVDWSIDRVFYVIALYHFNHQCLHSNKYVTLLHRVTQQCSEFAAQVNNVYIQSSNDYIQLRQNMSVAWPLNDGNVYQREDQQHVHHKHDSVSCLCTQMWN